MFSCSKCRLHFLFVRERVEHQRLHHGTHVKPPQLSRLKPGTKVGPPGPSSQSGTYSAQAPPTQLPVLCPLQVTVRTYSAVGKADHRKSLKRPEPCKVIEGSQGQRWGSAWFEQQCFTILILCVKEFTPNTLPKYNCNVLLIWDVILVKLR